MRIKRLKKMSLSQNLRDPHKFVLDIVRSMPYKYLKLDKGHTQDHMYTKNRDAIKSSMNLNRQE